MDYKGWALFCDCDFLWLDDVDKLFAQRDDKYAVMCVHHDYTPKEGTKMDGKQQTIYPRKNWSSMVLWNCGHPSNQQVIPSMVNKETGKFMHRFSWLKDSEIGQVSHEWNWLEGWYKEPADGKPKDPADQGGSWFENCLQDVDYADLWIDTANKTWPSMAENITFSKNGTDEYIAICLSYILAFFPTSDPDFDYENTSVPIVLRGILKHKIMKKCIEDKRDFRLHRQWLHGQLQKSQ